jgi:hypothetical protein
VQDRNTQEVLLDANVNLEAHQSGQASSNNSITHASYQDSENKLLQSGVLDLPESGDWLLKVLLNRNSQAAEFSFLLHVERKKAGPLPWPYLALGVIAGLLGFSYLRRHRRDNRHSWVEYDAETSRSAKPLI